MMNQDKSKLSIGQRIKEMREEKGVNQNVLADILGINSKTYGRYETDYTVITIDALTKISRYYEVSTDYILTGIPVGLNDALALLIAGHSDAHKESCLALIRFYLKELNTLQK